MDSPQKLSMNHTSSRKNSFSISSADSSAAYNVTTLRQNAEKILQNCKQTLEQILRSSDVSNHSVECIGLLMKNYSSLCLSFTNLDFKKQTKWVNSSVCKFYYEAQATDLIEQQSAEKLSLMAQLERVSQQHRRELICLNRTLQECRLEISELKQKVHQSEIQLFEIHEQKDSLHQLYQQTLSQRMSLISNLSEDIPVENIKDSLRRQTRILEFSSLLESEIDQLKTNLLKKEEIIHQNELIKVDLYQRNEAQRSLISDIKISYSDLEQQKRTLQQTVYSYSVRIDQLQQYIRELQQTNEKHSADLLKFDRIMDTRATEEEEDNVTQIEPQRDYKRRSSLYNIISKQENDTQKKPRISLALEIGLVDLESNNLRSNCNSDRSNCSANNKKNYRNLLQVTEIDDSSFQSPRSIKVDKQSILAESKIDNIFSTVLNKFRIVRQYINDIAIMQRVYRPRKGHYFH